MLLLECCGWESGLRVSAAEQIQRCPTAAGCRLSSSVSPRRNPSCHHSQHSPSAPLRPLVFFGFFLSMEILTLPEMCLSQLFHGDFCQNSRQEDPTNHRRQKMGRSITANPSTKHTETSPQVTSFYFGLKLLRKLFSGSSIEMLVIAAEDHVPG